MRKVPPTREARLKLERLVSLQKFWEKAMREFGAELIRQFTTEAYEKGFSFEETVTELQQFLKKKRVLIDENHIENIALERWAYHELQDLVKDYKLNTGFPVNL